MRASPKSNVPATAKRFQLTFASTLRPTLARSGFREIPRNPILGRTLGVNNVILSSKEQGEWNERNEGKVKIKILCHNCYEAARKKQTTEN